MGVWKEGASASQAIRENWMKNIPLSQTQGELLEQFGIPFPIDVLKEIYSLYEYTMNVQEGEQH